MLLRVARRTDDPADEGHVLDYRVDGKSYPRC
jgi:hypothetical protein